MPTTQAKYGLLTPLTAQSQQVHRVRDAIATELARAQADAGTVQWFGIHYTAHVHNFALFAAFATAAGRAAHAEAPGVLSPLPDAAEVEIVASAVKGGAAAARPLVLGMRVCFTAAPGRRAAVREFLQSAQPIIALEEHHAPVWFALAWPGTEEFATLVFFPTAHQRDAHLDGEVAKALFTSASELLVGAPEVTHFEVLGAKV